MSLKNQRLQLVKQLVEKDPSRYGYLIYQPFVTNIGANWHQFPNDFFQAIIDKINQFTVEYHHQVLSDDTLWGNKYKQFYNVYLKCYQTFFVAQQQLLQQQQIYYQQQQQQQFSQGGFGPQNQQYISNQNQTLTGNQQQQPYVQGQQKFQHQNNYQNYGQQKQPYTQQKGQINTPNQQQQPTTFTPQHTTFNQQGGQGGQTNYRPRQYQNYQQGGNQNYQNQNYQNQNQGNYQQNNQQQQNRNPRYNNNNGQTPHYNNNGQPNTYQNQQGFTHYNNNGQQGHHNNRPYNNYKHHNNYNNQYQQQQPQTQDEQVQQQPVVQQKPKVEEVVVPVEPPKPVPQPIKFSLNQIKSFISAWSDKDRQIVSKALVDKVNEVNGWTKGQANFQQKPEKSQNQKYDKNKNRGDRGENRGGDRDQKDGYKQSQFNTGKNYRTPQVPADLVKKNTGLVIKVGVNQTLESRKIKNQIKGKAGQDFATLMEKQNQGLGTLQLNKKQIIYNLNLLAPQNIADIKKDLLQYLFNQSTVCKILIQQIIQKAWAQPKYASTYAKLCQHFSKYPISQFKFATSKSDKDAQKEKKSKDNPFKVFLISQVQHSFDKKVQQMPQFNSDQQKDKYLTDTKKKILGNVKFIAELIRSKVLKKKIMKICISQLIYTFLAKYYYFRKSAKLIDSYFDYYFEALIQFIENVGQFYEKMDQSKQVKDQADSTSAFEPAQRKIIDLIQMNQKPPEEEITQINQLKADDYFKLFEIIDNRILKQKNSRLSALLLNLKERRTNKWQKHHSESDGPKKLKDIKQDIAKQEEQMNKIKIQKRQNMEHLHDLIKKMYQDWQNDAKNQRTHFKTILKQYTEVDFLTACLNQIADQKKQKVRKRVDLFDVILQNYFNLKNLQNAWIECVKFMAFNSGDFPFCSAAVALVLKKILTKQPKKIKEFYYKTQDEDEEFFTNEVYGKLYVYTNWQEIKDLTTPSKKYGNMLDEKVQSK